MGSTQAYFEQIIGLNVAQPRYENEGSGCGIRCYLQGKKDFFVRNYMETEHFMISPEPSGNHIGEDGVPVLAEEPREQDLKETAIVAESRAYRLMNVFRAFLRARRDGAPAADRENVRRGRVPLDAEGRVRRLGQTEAAINNALCQKTAEGVGL